MVGLQIIDTAQVPESGILKKIKEFEKEYKNAIYINDDTIEIVEVGEEILLSAFDSKYKTSNTQDLEKNILLYDKRTGKIKYED